MSTDPIDKPEGFTPPHPESIEGQLAPDIDVRWSHRFLIELRAMNTPGSDIGSAMVEANTHVKDSGQDPWTLFGDPANYAKSLDLPTTGRPQPPSRHGEGLILCATGGWMLIDACGASLHGEPTTVLRSGILLILGALFTLFLFFRPLTNLLLTRKWIAYALVFGIVDLIIFFIWFRGLSGDHWPTSWAWTIGSILMIAGVVPLLSSAVRGKVASEPVRFPEGTLVMTPEEPDSGGLVRWVLVGIIPFVVVLICGLRVLLNH